ncbi:MAG: cbb3-type cytochrome c oxidase subunit II [Niabella sp.]
MEWFNDHRKLFVAAFLFFAGLTILVAILPALSNEKISRPLPEAKPMSEDAIAGKHVFIANGCVACHTQQVRNVDMDKVWGKRPGVAADYALIRRTDLWRNTATLMGSERTGPDLTDVGNRQGSLEWNLTHLYNPRILVKESVMPAYPWMFEMKKEPAKGDVIVNVPPEFLNHAEGKVVAKKEALQLVAYLQSLKQIPLPDGTATPAFLYKRKAQEVAADNPAAEPDGSLLYTTHCQACHQENGEGLAGAFPPLKGSPIVLADNVDLFVEIVMKGYSGRESEGFGVMPAVGDNAGLTPEEVTAIMNHERTSWGNSAKKVTTEEVKKIMEFLQSNP